MISIIISSRDNGMLQNTANNIAQTIGVPYELVVIQNNEGKYGICKAYNQGADRAKYDILCFMHEDISFETQGWGQNVARHLSNKEIGLIGIAGGDTKSLVPSSWPSSIFQSEISIIQHYSDKQKAADKIVTTGYPDDTNLYKKVACIDGAWMCTRKDVFAKYRFDETTFKGFHCYDIDYSLQLRPDYAVCVVFDVLLHHYSEGSFNDVWLQSTILLSKKWRKQLPYSVRPLSKDEFVRQHWTSMNIFVEKMFELNYSFSFIVAQFLRFSCNRFFRFRYFLHTSKNILLKQPKNEDQYSYYNI